MRFISGTWTANILWVLYHNPRRFSELRTDMPKVSAKVLSARLKRMEKSGLINRTQLKTSPPSVEYSLTELGRELKPVIAAVIKVGEKLRQQRLA
ncbi:helix-turn-helix domain-containing protein [Bdellovibrio sp. NC01]|uniref:winged helix-turn-helix transcriptional regulator n=1 Tax=Bdellovibrio sp. NC01 TaxID=2220073 RepID=UPI001AEF8089|nr:helix-turn-helix domain-containing protein [Bdellovibrio sp. NC01]